MDLKVETKQTAWTYICWRSNIVNNIESDEDKDYNDGNGGGW